MVSMSQLQVDSHEARMAAGREMRTAKQHNAELCGEVECIRNEYGDVTERRIHREADLHAQIFDECRRRGWIAFHGAMSRPSSRTLGEPDFEIYADGGRSFLIECKMPNGKLSKEQRAMIAHACKLGHEIHVVRSFAQFLEVVK